MAGSTGVRHNPLNDIRALRDLVKRYHLGFPIIKELLQNADDAGATRLEIGWLPGLVDAKNPLLTGPGTFVLNNGPFTSKNAWAIEHIGQTDKAGQHAAIGKFGVGLKSVFHLCEAFVYLSSEQVDGPGPIPVLDATLFNPWKGDGDRSYHSEWDDFSLVDQQAIYEAIRPVAADGRWFCLWLPLRRQEHFKPGLQPIVPEWYGDLKEGDLKRPPPFLGGDSDGLARQLVPCMPLLKSVRTIRVWLPAADNNAVEPKLTVALSAGAQRSRFLRAPIPSGYSPIEGQVTVRGPDGQERTSVFAGVETLLRDSALTALQDGENWPGESVEDPETGELDTVREKADPHAAVVITRSPAEGQGRLSLSEAVFLPIGEPPKPLPCRGVSDFDVTLHGYFFTNADRTRIDLDAPDAAGGDEQLRLRRGWNRRLYEQGTLSSILPALNRFASTAGPDELDLQRLTKTLRSTLPESELSAVCREHQWANCLTPEGGDWRLLDAKRPIYLLPNLPRNRPRIFDLVFPSLGKLCPSIDISLDGSARIAVEATPIWREEHIVQLLESVSPDSVFRDAEQLGYLAQFLERNLGLVEKSPAIQDLLVRLLGEALHEIGPNAFSGSSDFHSLVGWVDLQRILRVRVGDRARSAVDPTFRFLAGIDAGVLLLPRDLSPAASGRGSSESSDDAAAR